MTPMNATRVIRDAGQSLWLDNITRAIVDDGTLRRYVDDLAVTGLTSNPTIFANAIRDVGQYGEAIAAKLAAGRRGEQLFFELAIEDLRRAAALFAPIHERTGGLDGWVSLEVSPLLAHDAASTLRAAIALHRQASVENLLVKIPGTTEGLSAAEDAIFAGIPVNVTLLFSVEQYRAAAEAYLRGVERRVAAGLDPAVGSVASVFVSRWDGAVAGMAPLELRNRLGIALSQRTYGAYREMLSSERWLRLQNEGARPQRLLWASTGTKDPEIPDTWYVDALVAPLTVNTIPEKTLLAVGDHGVSRARLSAGGPDADEVLGAFAAAGIDFRALAATLQSEGADSFAASWRDLMACVDGRCADVAESAKGAGALSAGGSPSGPRVPEVANVFSTPSAAPDLEPTTIVVFGATGDLARRKLLPALYHLFRAGFLPDRWRLIGSSSEDLSDAAFRDHVRASIAEFGRVAPQGEAWDAFASASSYVGGQFGPGLTDPVRTAVEAAAAKLGGHGKLFFAAVPPSAFEAIARGLGEARLTERARVILEKPFGTDLGSARALNALLHAVLSEEQVFRIDHFLGKEAVQNLLAFRFANGLFEPVWNRTFIDHVQLDVPEALGIGTRGSFYEATGAFRDMVVTHLLQVLAFVAMEPPSALTPKALIDEKVKVFESMRPLAPGDVVRGQYEGYLEEDGVSPGSRTETFVAGRVMFDSWRWSGVPFFFRTGKRLAEGRRALTIVFKSPPLALFERAAVPTGDIEANHLTFDLADNGSIAASFLAKAPGPDLRIAEAHMEFRHGGRMGGGVLEAYERLIHDALIGDRTLFTRADGIERLWQAVAPVLDDPPPLRTYPVDSWGPEAAISELIAPRGWHLPSNH